jgi:hypothetical protein
MNPFGHVMWNNHVGKYSRHQKEYSVFKENYYNSGRQGESLLGKPNIALLGTESLFSVLFLLWTTEQISNKFKQ